MQLDRSQFEILAMEHLDLLHRLAKRMARDAPRAEGLVQETYLRAFRSADDFDLQSYGIRPWLIRILHNLNVSGGQKDRRRPGSMADEHLETAAVARGGMAMGNWGGAE